MEQEKDKSRNSNLKINFREIEELMNLLDPNEEIFVNSKTLVKELKADSSKIVNEDEGVLRR